MNRYFLKSLAQTIVASDGLKMTEAKKLTELLSPKELRKLTELILLEDEKGTALITTADKLSKNEKETVGKIFKVKKVVDTVDKKIGGGIRAQVYDMIYDLSMKSKIESIAEELEDEL